jgi:hypothetical protein
MLQIYSTMIDALHMLRPVLVAIERHDADLGKQLRRAAASVALNLAEGSGSAAGTRTARYRTALGSARGDRRLPRRRRGSRLLRGRRCSAAREACHRHQRACEADGLTRTRRRAARSRPPRQPAPVHVHVRPDRSHIAARSSHEVARTINNVQRCRTWHQARVAHDGRRSLA